jgi:protein arginine kinase
VRWRAGMAEALKSFRPEVGWAATGGAWPDMVFSTRVRLARNLAGCRFTGRAAPDKLAELRRQAFAAARDSGLFPRGHFLRIEALGAQDRAFLSERHHISPSLAEGRVPSGAVVANDEACSVMVNEEDHLRLQSLRGGFAIDEAFAAALKLDEALGGRLEYSYDDRFGFLTACPTNAGTGLRVSCLAHLPAMTRLGRMPQALEGLGRLGVIARGIYGEGTCVLGDYYQVSNAACLGRSEEDICRSMDTVVRNLLRQEIAAREELLAPAARLRTEDAVFRSLGLLRHARSVSYGEFMQNVSLVRMGAAMALPVGADFGTLNQLALLMQPAHIQAAAGRALSPAERDAFRADCLRQSLAQ